MQSGLLDADALHDCWESLPEEKRTPDAVDRRIARQAVNAGLLTVWQAQQLMTGRASGFKIDRYVLVDLIGQGGMGRVYLAKDTRLGRQVAIKVLSTSRMSNPRAIARFQREGKVGAQLQHENLVRIYDEGESSNIRYLVMEFIEGKNIAQLIGEQGAIPWAAAVRLVRQVALGLEHAHLKGLIHRDVNPSNILVTRDGTAKLTDLGLAIDLADEGNVTRDGATVGTFDYISPEQARHSRDVDTRADIYSLGCTLYHMIAGRVPFPVPSLPEKLYAHQLHDADALHSLVNDVPENLSRVVKKMMAKRAEDRYPTPITVAQALEPFLDEAARLSPAILTTRSVSGEFASIGPKTKVAAPVRMDAPAGDAVPATTATSPAAQVSDPDLAMFSVDVGPVESLSSSLTGSLRTKPKSTSVELWDGEGKPPRRPPWAAIGVAVLVLMAVGVVVGVVAANRKKGSESRIKAGSTAKSATDVPPRIDVAKLDPAKASAITVVSRGETRATATLAEAIGIAMGSNGEVVLNPTGPIRLSTSTDLFRIPRGNVTIRAAEGTTPLIAIDIGSANSLFLITSPGTLTLKGLKIVANYQALEKPPPLIQSGGALRLEGCTFVASGASSRSRVVLVEGLKFEVEGCLFVGFHRTVDIDLFPGSVVSIKQSIIVPAGTGAGTPGWALKAQLSGTRAEKPTQTPRRISIDHATIKGGGLFDLSGFSAARPLAVDLDHVAVQTRALLAWTPLRGDREDQWPKGLKWTGKGSLYDVTGSPWVLVSADAELPMPNAPADLKTWTELLGSDKDSTARSFNFANPPTAIDGPSTNPDQFALVGEGVAGVGADPKKVGPHRP